MQLTETRKLIWFTDKVSVHYDTEDKCITAFDHTDQLNQPAAYTRNKRGLKHAIKEIETLPAKASFEDVIEVLQDNNLKPHRWCLVD